MKFFKINQILNENKVIEIRKAIDSIPKNVPLTIIIGKEKYKVLNHPFIFSSNLSGGAEIVLPDRSIVDVNIIDAIEFDGKIIYPIDKPWWMDHQNPTDEAPKSIGSDWLKDHS